MDNLVFTYPTLYWVMQFLLTLDNVEDELFVKPDTGLVVIYGETNTYRALLCEGYIRIVHQTPYGFTNETLRYDQNIYYQIDQDTAMNGVIWNAILDYGFPMVAQEIQ